MINLKMTQKDIKLSIILISLIILGVTYQFIYVKNMDKTDLLQSDNKKLNLTLTDEKAKYLKKKDMLADTKTLCSQINTVISSYGDGASEEKNLMFIKSMEGVADMKVNSAAFTKPEYFLTSTNEKLSASMDYADIASLNGYKVTITLAFQVSYDGLKKCLDFINDYPQKCSVGGLTVSFDSETGNLSGSMDISMYHLQGGNRKYTDPIIASTDTGTGNIFGTIELPAN